MSKWSLFESLLHDYVDARLDLIYAVGIDIKGNKEKLKEDAKNTAMAGSMKQLGRIGSALLIIKIDNKMPESCYECGRYSYDEGYLEWYCKMDSHTISFNPYDDDNEFLKCKNCPLIEVLNSEQMKELF